MRPDAGEQGSVFWAVLAVLLVTSLLFSTIIFYGAWHRAQNRRFLYQVQAHYLALAALEQARCKIRSSLSSESIIADDLLTDSLPNRQSWRTQITPWGCYWRAVCRGKSRQTTQMIDALIGYEPASLFDFALGLFGPPYPLVIAGETQITGDVSLGPADVMSGQFQGRNRGDSVLVRGRVVTDPLPQAPVLDWSIWEEFRERAMRQRNRLPVRSDRFLVIDDQFNLTDADSVVIVDAPVTINCGHKLRSPSTLLLLATGPVTIGGMSRVDARWAIFSDRSIEVKDSARLAGVILCAPRIHIGDAARFSGQVIADTLLEITDRASSIFPCLLWVTGNGNPNAHLLLSLKSLEPCQGIAGLSPLNGPWDWLYRSQKTGQLLLMPHAQWTGYLVARGRAEIQGTVLGSVQAELLAIEDPPTTYLNWLVDARLDRQAWNGRAVLPAVFRDGGSATIAEFTLPSHDSVSPTEAVPRENGR